MFDKNLFALAMGIACITPAITVSMESVQPHQRRFDKNDQWLDELPLFTGGHEFEEEEVSFAKVGEEIREHLLKYRDTLKKYGFYFQDDLLDMPFNHPREIIPALERCDIEIKGRRVPIFILIKDADAKEAAIEVLQKLPLEVLEFFEYLSGKCGSFLSRLPQDVMPVEAGDLSNIIYDTFHQAAESKRSYFGQFARLTLGGKVTVGIGAVFAGLGVVKAVEWVQKPQQTEENETERYAY